MNAVAEPLVTVLSVSDLKTRVKAGSYVLWVYRDQVEEGSVLSIRGTQLDLIWLEGYRSRNDTVDIAEVLSLHDKDAPEMRIFPFSGKGYFTQKGLDWQAAHPRD